jgi:hypothetical protein
MGSPDGEEKRDKDESPQRQVTVVCVVANYIRPKLFKHPLTHPTGVSSGVARLNPDFSQSLKKQGSKTAKMHIAQQFQQFEV